VIHPRLSYKAWPAANSRATRVPGFRTAASVSPFPPPSPSSPWKKSESFGMK
jgi:hypothetical protein